MTKVKKIKLGWYFFMAMFFVYSCSSLNLSPKKIQTKESQNGYDYVIAPKMTECERSDYYSCEEIESFLCASSQNFINSGDIILNYSSKLISNQRASFQSSFNRVEQVWVFPSYRLKPKKINQKQREIIGNFEINKWFENEVTVICKGLYNQKDIELLKYFLGEVNKIIGKEKFLFKENSSAGNIVVEFLQDEVSDSLLSHAGETICLEDNMKVILYLVGGEMVIDTYKTGSGIPVSESYLVMFTARENAFRKNNRIVKIYILNIEDRNIRDMVMIHELMHAIGFNGHSPYLDSNLFPLPVPIILSNKALSLIALGKELKTKLSPLARAMIEILYRPEILPGMTIREAGELLVTLKLKNKTSIADQLNFMEKRKNELERRKTDLLKMARLNIEIESELKDNLGRLKKEKAKLLQDINKESIYLKKFVIDKNPENLLKQGIELTCEELELLELEFKKMTDKDFNNKERRRIEQIIRKKTEDIEIWSEMLADLQGNRDEISFCDKEKKRMKKQNSQISLDIRRIIRQLSAIRQEALSCLGCFFNKVYSFI